MYSAEMKTGENVTWQLRQMPAKKSKTNRQKKDAAVMPRPSTPNEARGCNNRRTTLLDHIEHPFHPLLPVALEEEEFLGAVERVGSGPGWRELDHFRLLAQ